MRAATIALLLFASTLSAQERGLVITSDSIYSLQPGDVVRIDVWGRDDFSGQFQVNERGSIEYPGIGELNTVNLSVRDLRDSIRTVLGTIFNRPFVTITPLFRMAVLGHVQRPGLYTVDPTLTVFDMVAMAGGPTADGDLNKIGLLREGEQTRVSFEEEGLHGRTLQELGVRSGDQILVGRKRFTTTDLLFILQAAQLIISIAILLRT